MEEYARGEEEATPELQTIVIQDERVETRTGTEQQPKKGRKRKRDVEESETKQGEDVEVDDLVFERVHIVMEQTLMRQTLKKNPSRYCCDKLITKG